MTKRYEVKRVKSAARVLEVLEYFTPERQHATVMDIARSMGYPQSSTSELLSCLVALGYLHCDRRARTYWPSARVALLGAWVQPTLFRQGHILSALDILADQTGAAVVLSSRVEIWAQCIHIVPGDSQTTPPQVGTREILTQIPAGKLLLSTLDREQAKRMIHRINAEVSPEDRVSPDQILADIREVSIRKFAGGNNAAGDGIVAMLLPQAPGNEPLIISLYSPLDDLMKNLGDYLQILRSTLAKKMEWTPSAMLHNIKAEPACAVQLVA